MHIRSQRLASDVLQYKLIHMIGVKQMLRYEEIIKEFLQDNNIKFKGMQDDRILVEDNGDQKVFKVTLVENNLIIKNVYDEIEYTIELK